MLVILLRVTAVTCKCFWLSKVFFKTNFPFFSSPATWSSSGSSSEMTRRRLTSPSKKPSTRAMGRTCKTLTTRGRAQSSSSNAVRCPTWTSIRKTCAGLSSPDSCSDLQNNVPRKVTKLFYFSFCRNYSFLQNKNKMF